MQYKFKVVKNKKDDTYVSGCAMLTTSILLIEFALVKNQYFYLNQINIAQRQEIKTNIVVQIRQNNKNM